MMVGIRGGAGEAYSVETWLKDMTSNVRGIDRRLLDRLCAVCLGVIPQLLAFLIPGAVYYGAVYYKDRGVPRLSHCNV